MRLTNNHRKDFADKVMKKIPMKSNWTLDKIVEAVRLRLFLAQPIKVQQFAKEYPKQTNWTTTCVYWLDHMWDDRWHSGRVPCVNGSDLDQINTDDLKDFWEAYKAERQDRKTMYNRIYDQACGCTTLAQLQAVFPDLHGLMPKPVVAVKSLPVAAKGLTDDLVAIGLEIPQ